MLPIFSTDYSFSHFRFDCLENVCGGVEFVDIFILEPNIVRRQNFEQILVKEGNQWLYWSVRDFYAFYRPKVLKKWSKSTLMHSLLYFPFFTLQENLDLNAELTEMFYLMYLNDSQNGQKANSSFLGFILHAKIKRHRLLSLRSKSKYNKQAFGPIFFPSIEILWSPFRVLYGIFQGIAKWCWKVLNPVFLVATQLTFLFRVNNRNTLKKCVKFVWS